MINAAGGPGSKPEDGAPLPQQAAPLAQCEQEATASTQTHQALAEMVDQIGYVFFTLDRAWHFRYVTPHAAENVGLTPDELLGKTLWEMFPQLLGTIYETHYRRAMAERRPVRFDAQAVLSGRWYETTVYPSEHGLSIYGRDITQRKEAEAALAARANQQAVVAALGQSALRGVDLDTLMAEAVEQISQALGTEYAKVLELLPDGQALLLRAGVGWKPDYSVGRTTVSAGRDSQAGYTLLSSTPVVVDDLRTEPRFNGPRLLLDHGVVSGMSVIIHGRQGPYGVLGTHTQQKRTFTQDQIDFLQAIANLLAQAIDRKEVEDELRATAGQLGAVVNAAVDGIITIDTDGTVRSVNPAVGRIFGYRPEELIGRNVSLLMPEPYRSEHDTYLANYLRTGEAQIIGIGREVEGQRKDGTRFPLDLAVSEVDLGTHRLFTGIVRDITQRKEAEKALQQANQALSTTLERISDLFISYDREWRIIYVNQRMLALGGKPPEELIGRVLWEIFPEVTGTPYELKLRAAMAAQTPVHFEMSGLYTGRWYEFACYPSPDGLSVFGRDISERKQAEAEEERLLQALAQERAKLQDLTETLEMRVQERTRQVRRLAARLSLAEHQERKRIAQLLHDHVQQLLYGIQWQINLAKSELSSEQAAASGLAYLAETQRLADESIQAVRTLSVELSPPVLEQEGLPQAINWWVQQMQSIHALAVVVDVRGDCQMADRNLRMVLFQIVRELLFNVVKHAQVKQATVTLRQEEGRIVARVADEGKGFAAPSVSASRDDIRTGFGLSSIRERLELFDGQLTIESAPGAGTEVTVALPLPGEGDQHTGPAARPAASQPSPAGNGRKGERG